MLTAEVETARWFDALLEAGAEPKQAANWVVAELFGALNRRGESIEKSPVTPAAGRRTARPRRRRHDQRHHRQAGVRNHARKRRGRGRRSSRSRGLKQTSDTGAIDEAIDKILAANADKVEQYKAGKEALFGFFVGQVMKAMAGKANPQARQRTAAGETGLTDRHPAKAGVPDFCAGWLRQRTPASARVTRRVAMRLKFLAPSRPLFWRRSRRRSRRSRRPKLLLVVISVDQFSADLFDEYRPQFTGGLARLASGTVFHNGYQSHATTETCPGHSTILTGDRPARTGIIANAWFDHGAARADKMVYCAEDESAPGSSSTNYTVSPAAPARADARRADEAQVARQPAMSRSPARTAPR